MIVKSKEHSNIMLYRNVLRISNCSTNDISSISENKIFDVLILSEA